MTHTEQAKFIDQTGYVGYDGMLFLVEVIDVRQIYNDTQVLVRPLNGGRSLVNRNDDDACGASWKSTASVRFTGESLSKLY